MKYNWEIERSLLGGLMLDPTQLPEVRERIAPRDFHRPQHGAILALMIRMAESGGAIDIASIMDDVGKRDAFEEYGGAAYLATLPSWCATVENLATYATRIREHADRRSMVLSLTTAIERLKAGEDLGPIAAETTAALATKGEMGVSPWKSARQLATAAMVDILNRDPNVMPGAATGLRDLDEKLWGLKRQTLTIVGARPAMGKSAFAGTIARNAGCPVGIVSIEMPGRTWMERWAVAEAGLSAEAVRKGRLSRDDRRNLEMAAERLYELPIYIDDAGSQDMDRIRMAAHRLVRDHGAELLIVDYLGLVEPDDPRMNQTQAITRISAGLNGLKKELDLPLVVLSQLNRSCEARTDKRPQTSDLRDSGAIEQDADTILFLYRDEVYNPETPDRGIMEIIIAKHRGGPLGTIRVAASMERMWIRDLAQDYA